MKRSKLLFVFLMAAVACSKKDEPAPALQNTKVTTTTVQTPAALTTAANTNVHAQEVVSYVALANGMSSYTNLFAAPSGATKSSTTIKASNGRVAATASATETYTWSDPQYGSVAFQITDEGTSYKWEYFYKSPGSDWLKFLNAEEMKDGSSGDLEVLDFTGDDPNAIELKFNWTKKEEKYTFQWTDPFSYFLLTMNTTTKAGSIDYYNGTGVNAVKAYQYSWTADGHGKWISFDSTGTQNGTGTW